jgi:hypothetical protein
MAPAVIFKLICRKTRNDKCRDAPVRNARVSGSSGTGSSFQREATLKARLARTAAVDPKRRFRLGRHVGGNGVPFEPGGHDPDGRGEDPVCDLRHG